LSEIDKNLNHQQVSGTDLLKVLLVTISWGLNYPIMKFVLNSYPPSIFRAFTFLLGFISLGLIAIVTNTSLRVPADERFIIFRLSMFNMVGWHVPMIYGVSMLNSGRAAIIGYTMPVWAMLSCVLFYKEKITLRSLLGLCLAMSAVFLLVFSSDKQWGNNPIGVAVMLIAAITWGLGNAMMKNNSLSVNGIALTFWALFIAFIIFTLIAFAFERENWQWPNIFQWLAIVYGGVITFALSYVAWFHVARKLSPVNSGLSIMLVPVFGVTGGAFLLGEAVSNIDIAALILILIAMAVVLIPKEKWRSIFNGIHH
jgi:drug/metabolite transporter (DMT)-like permease